MTALTKTRAIPFSEEKVRQKTKQYYKPARYTTKKKTPGNVSAYVKTEDLI